MNKIIKKFFKDRSKDIQRMNKDNIFKKLSLKWLTHSLKYKYNYNFTWMGRPIIRFPNDLVVMQEVLWKVKPDLIIETGIAHGGSIIFSASMLKMMGIKNFKVIGVDVDIRKHNLNEINKHPMKRFIKMFEGDSNSSLILNRIKKIAKNKKRVLVVLDSDHSYAHVAKELKNYSKFVSKNSYIICPDTYIDFLPKKTFKKWKKGDNTYIALKEFLKQNKKFKIDRYFSDKAIISETFDGYIKRTGN